MGSSQSARKLTITNDQNLGVIHISNGVAQRLAQGVESIPQGQNSAQQTPSQEWDSRVTHPEPPSLSARPESTPTAAEPIRRTTTEPAQLQPEYTVSALKMHQQKEQELFNQNLYWQKRLRNLEENHAKIDNILEEEYKRAVAQVAAAQGNKKVDVSSVSPACIEKKERVVKCYQEHPREILHCSALVEEFSNCVDQRRLGLVAARC